MCRHAAYVGPAVSISTLTHASSHDLVHQSYEARELLTGVVCADGFGVTWYEPSTRPEPARYASAMPIWSDRNLSSFGPLVQSECIMAAVRNATVAGTSSEENCAPFTSGRYAFSLNGFLEDFESSWQPWVIERIAPERQSLVRGKTDGEFLFQAVLTRVDEGDDLATATQSILREAADHAAAIGKEAQLNILLTDGGRVIATRCGTAGRSNSLYVLADGDDLPGSVVVASEPLMDDSGWKAVDDGSVVVLQAGAPAVRLTV